MVLTAENYAEVLVGTLPHGQRLRRDRDSNVWKLMLGLGGELARVDGRAADLLREADPSRTSELLTDWERLVGLPDECSPTTSTDEERREAVLERLATIGDQRPAAYVDLALALGVIVTVDEPAPMLCGDERGSSMYDEAWRHVFFVRAPATTVTDFLCGDLLGCRTPGSARPARAFVTYGV